MTDAIQTADRNCAVFQNGASPNKLSAAPGSSVANPFQIYVQSRWTCPSVRPSVSVIRGRLASVEVEAAGVESVLVRRLLRSVVPLLAHLV